MKAYTNNFSHKIRLIMMISAIIFITTACENECVNEWSDCYNRCPTQEEGDQAVGDCIDDCRAKYPNGQPIEDFSKCAVACYNKSREACVDRCGDQLQRCLE